MDYNLIYKLTQELEGAITELKRTLITIDEDPTQSIDCIGKNIKRISDVLQQAKDNNLTAWQIYDGHFPLCDLLRVGPLTRIEIPLDVVNMFISDIDLSSDEGEGFVGGCYFDLAIELRHYNVIRLLITRGVKILSKDVSDLIQQENLPPLDIFDMLLPPHIINDSRKHTPLPLHLAAYFGRTEIALHLIKLGANVDQLQCLEEKLPIECLLIGPAVFNDIELFMALLPSKPLGVDNFKAIVSTLYKPDRGYKTGMLQQLLQRLIIDEPLEVEIVLSHSHNFMTVNKGRIFRWVGRDFAPLHGVHYLSSLILVSLQPDFVSTPSEVANDLPDVGEEDIHDTFTRAFDDVWKTCRQQCLVKSLLRLCIKTIRSSMKTLSDAGFESLPVPLYLRRCDT